MLIVKEGGVAERPRPCPPVFAATSPQTSSSRRTILRIESISGLRENIVQEPPVFLGYGIAERFVLLRELFECATHRFAFRV